MGYIEGTGRGQNALWSLEDLIPEESMVRVIDRFIEIQDLAKLGFTRSAPAETGRPAYPPKAMAKLYVYGYENGLRSSRKLERETRRNVEAMWLMDGLTPDHKTISEFRRQNIRPLQKLFREFVKLCRSWELIGGDLFAVDGTKIKAGNNKKNNFSRKKLNDRLARLDEKIAEYLAAAEAEDSRESEKSGGAPEGLQALLSRKELYESYLAQLDETGENEVSAVDPDARLMGNNRGGVDVAYNVQSSVDGEHDLIVDYHVSLNPSDQGQLGNMAKRLKGMGYRRFTVLADKGYYSGADLRKAKKYRIKAVVSRQGPPDPKEQPEEFHSKAFLYNDKEDVYTCPEGKTLYPHNKKAAKRRSFYNKTACSTCPHRDVCTKGGGPYRTVTRSQYSAIYAEADRVFEENKELYKRRQQIVEHPFGTVKHAMGGGYFLLRTRRKVRCEVALLFLGYDLKRALKIVGFQGLMDRLETLFQRFFIFLAALRANFTAAERFFAG